MQSPQPPQQSSHIAASPNTISASRLESSIPHKKKTNGLWFNFLLLVSIYLILVITFWFRIQPLHNNNNNNTDSHPPLQIRNFHQNAMQFSRRSETTTSKKKKKQKQKQKQQQQLLMNDEEKAKYEKTIHKLVWELDNAKMNARTQITNLKDEIQALHDQLDKFSEEQEQQQQQQQQQSHKETHSFETPAPEQHSTTRKKPMDGVDVPPRPHPHAGAKDQFGHWGYVHDPTAIRQSPPPFRIPISQYGEICADPAHGPEGPGGYRLLTEKVVVDFGNHHRAERISRTDRGKPRVKLFCAVYTHHGAEELLYTLEETWGWRCDGFMAASSYTNHTLGIVNIPHLGKMGAYTSIWQKVRSMWSYIHDYYLEDYDFFHICGDDTYLLVENLRLFLESEKVVKDGGGEGYPNPLYIGHWLFDKQNETYYAGGGSGYTINRATLSQFITHKIPTCHVDKIDNAAAEDKFIGDCFREMDITAYDARDALGEHRYHGFDPNFVFKFRLYKYGKIRDRITHFWSEQNKNSPRKFGFEAASNVSVAFHILKTPAKMRRVHKLLYRKEERDCTMDDGEENEPGVVATEEMLLSVPHKDCEWNNTIGVFMDCPEYKQVIQSKVPPEGWKGVP